MNKTAQLYTLNNIEITYLLKALQIAELTSKLNIELKDLSHIEFQKLSFDIKAYKELQDTLQMAIPTYIQVKKTRSSTKWLLKKQQKNNKKP